MMDDGEHKLGNEYHSGSIHHLDQPITEDILTPSKIKKKSKDQDHEITESHVNSEAIKIIDDQIAAAALHQEDNTTCGCQQSTFKISIGLVIVILIAVSWTGTTQFGKSSYSVHFKAPYFTTWFTTCFMVVIYPLFMIPLICRKSPWRLRTFLRQTATIFGPQGFCLHSLVVYLFKIIIPFLAVWLLTNYLYFRSLEKLLPGTVTAVFSSTSCFVYILSLIFLKDKLFVLRILSVLISIGGIVLMGYSEGFGNSNTIGIVFVILAALGSAFYQVMFKVVMSKANGAQVALFLTLLGAGNILLFWPIILVMDYMQYETIEWDQLPWKFLGGTAVLGVLFNYLVNFGISITFPLFISVGTLLGMPLSAGVDALFRDSGFGHWKIASALLIIFGFVLMLIPEEKLLRIERKHFCRDGTATNNNGTDSIAAKKEEDVCKERLMP